MNVRKSLLRHVALIFAAHARRNFSKRGAFWADGMEQEAHHIQNDGRALVWALGCVFASYRELSADFLNGAIRVFLGLLILYFSCENFLIPVQALLCHLQLSKPALELLVFFPIERSMCIPWPAIPVDVQVMSLGAGALYVTSAWKLIRIAPAAILWFLCAFAAGSVALMGERSLPTISISVSVDHALLNIIVGRAIFPMLVAVALWLSSASYIRPNR